MFALQIVELVKLIYSDASLGYGKSEKETAPVVVVCFILLHQEEQKQHQEIINTYFTGDGTFRFWV